MFKAALIDNKRIVTLMRRQLFLFFLPSIPMAFIVNYYHLPLWVIVVSIVLYVLFGYFLVKNSKELAKLTNKEVEIDSSQIRIKTKTGQLLETIDFDKADKIFFKKTFKRLDYLEVVQNNETRRIDFEHSSDYMRNQFRKVIETWGKKATE